MRVTPIHPASCKADTPLPINTTASTTTNMDVTEKNVPSGIRALVRSNTHAITTNNNKAVKKPAINAPLLPSAASAE